MCVNITPVLIECFITLGNCHTFYIIWKFSGKPAVFHSINYWKMNLKFDCYVEWLILIMEEINWSKFPNKLNWCDAYLLMCSLLCLLILCFCSSKKSKPIKQRERKMTSLFFVKNLMFDYLTFWFTDEMHENDHKTGKSCPLLQSQSNVLASLYY